MASLSLGVQPFEFDLYLISNLQTPLDTPSEIRVENYTEQNTRRRINRKTYGEKYLKR